MSDLVVAFGLVLVIEGLIWALLPSLGISILESVSQMPAQSLRIAGACSMAVGVFLVWLIRG